MKLLSCIVILALTLSPAMAQKASAPDPTIIDASLRSLTQVVRESSTTKAEADFRNVAKHSAGTAIPLTASRRDFSEPKAPGNSKWVILAGLMAAGAVVAAILLWPEGGDKDPGPVGTVIAPGTPAVAAPGGQ